MVEALNQKVDRFREELVGQIRFLDGKLSKWFILMVGFQIAALLSILGLFLKRILTLS